MRLNPQSHTQYTVERSPKHGSYCTSLPGAPTESLAKAVTAAVIAQNSLGSVLEFPLSYAEASLSISVEEVTTKQA